jgi:hypothetical protein
MRLFAGESSSDPVTLRARQKEDVVIHKLRNQNVSASSIGAFTKSKRRVLQHRNRTMTFPRIAEDPYAKIMLK